MNLFYLQLYSFLSNTACHKAVIPVDPGVAECEGSVAECQVSQTEKMMKAVQPVQRL